MPLRREGSHTRLDIRDKWTRRRDTRTGPAYPTGDPSRRPLRRPPGELASIRSDWSDLNVFGRVHTQDSAHAIILDVMDFNGFRIAVYEKRYSRRVAERLYDL